MLGFLYENGFGVPTDYVAAWMWYESAVGHGITDGRGGDAAISVRDGIAKKMTLPQIEQAKARAAAWKPTTGNSAARMAQAGASGTGHRRQALVSP